MQIVRRLFIDGAFAEPHGTDVLTLADPASGNAITQVMLADEIDTKRAISAACRAFERYSKQTLATRREYLQRIHDVMAKRMDDLLEIVSLEYGAPRWFARFALQDALGHWLHARDLVTPDTFQYRLSEGAEVSLEPAGVAGLICPWNIGVWFMCVKTSTALAAGCTVVLKPSELSARQNDAMAEIFAEADLPPGLVNVLNGTGPIVGEAITRSPDISKISFTGSTSVGKLVAKSAADTMKRLTLELGGKSPSIILEDADLERAIQFVLLVGLQNSGQSCTAGTRILIPESRQAEMLAALKSGIEAMKLGSAGDEDSTIGPMVSERQFDRVQSYIRRGIEEGAVLLTGGPGRPAGLETGNFVKPTIFTNVNSEMSIAREEIFGPVLCVLTYRNDEDAIRIANDSPYGLHAYIAGTDLQRAKTVASRLRVGRVAINGFVEEPRAPFGGFKQSGIGREFGRYGLESFLEPKATFVVV